MFIFARLLQLVPVLALLCIYLTHCLTLTCLVYIIFLYYYRLHCVSMVLLCTCTVYCIVLALYCATRLILLDEETLFRFSIYMYVTGMTTKALWLWRHTIVPGDIMCRVLKLRELFSNQIDDIWTMLWRNEMHLEQKGSTQDPYWGCSKGAKVSTAHAYGVPNKVGSCVVLQLRWTE